MALGVKLACLLDKIPLGILVVRQTIELCIVKCSSTCYFFGSKYQPLGDLGHYLDWERFHYFDLKFFLYGCIVHDSDTDSACHCQTSVKEFFFGILGRLLIELFDLLLPSTDLLMLCYRTLSFRPYKVQLYLIMYLSL